MIFDTIDLAKPGWTAVVPRVKNLTKKQIKLNKKLRHMQTKAYIKKQEKKEINKKFKDWAELVKTRDNNKCVICGETKQLNAHHIIPREIKELRFDINNGISLCPKHHQFSLEISPHRNPFVFLVWLLNNRNRQFIYLSDFLSINREFYVTPNDHYDEK